MTARRWIVSILALCVVAGASFAVSSAICSRRTAVRNQSTMGQGMSLVTGYLQLTPEQETRVAPINERFRTEQHAACAEMQDARARLLSVLKRPEPKQEDVDEALADLEQKQAKLQRRAAQYLLELKPLLTDDQQAKLFDLVGQRFCEQGRCGGGICPGVGKPVCNGRAGCMR